MIARALPALSILIAAPTEASEPAGLHEALESLAKAEQFSGAVVIRDSGGVQFARAYGSADPFTGRDFTVDTPVDSGSLAKPLTAAAVLALAAEGKIKLDAPAQAYLAEIPFATITIRQLLSHSAGVTLGERAPDLALKSNLDLIMEARGKPLLFPPGTRFSYCNWCTIALAELVERVSGLPYLDFARTRLRLSQDVSLRPAELAKWQGRAIGYRRSPDGKIERFDSWEGERFYGSANLSISASQLAEWGAQWLQPSLSSLTGWATADATIGGSISGLTLGNWYCAADKSRCHYLGHHEGFHHMLYWDSSRKLSVAMVSNNALSPTLIPRLQRAIIAFAEGRAADGRTELARPLSGRAPAFGKYRQANGDEAEFGGDEDRPFLRWRGIAYPAYPVHPAVRYVPGLDAYVVAPGKGSLQWVTLYADNAGNGATPRRR